MLFEELRSFEPSDWPGRCLVEQDNMGDWGGWLQDFDGPLQDVLQSPTDDVEPLARAIAEAYLAGCRDAGFALPADFDETGDREAAEAADEAAIIAEFTVYLQAWQAAVTAKQPRYPM